MGASKPARVEWGKGMGRLSEYFNGYRGTRSSYLSNVKKTGGFKRSGFDVTIEGADEFSATLGRLMTTDYNLATSIRKVIRQLLREARSKLSKDARNYMKSDPRKAARAVRNTVYKQVFGGNLNILYKRKATSPTSYKKPRTLRPGQIGGNRRPIGTGTSTSRIEGYGGSDRGFILRFINAGTDVRETRYGKRGSMRQTDWFAHTAPWHIREAADQFVEIFNEYVKQTTN